MLSLPNDVWLEICCYLDWKRDVLQTLTLVSKPMRDFITHIDCYWKWVARTQIGVSTQTTNTASWLNTVRTLYLHAAWNHEFSKHGLFEFRLNTVRLLDFSKGWNKAVIGKVPLRHGIHSYRFQVVECESIMFGIISSHNNCEKLKSSHYWPGQGHIGVTRCSNSVAYYSSYAREPKLIEKHDVIEMIIDMKQQTVWFIQNDQEVGHASWTNVDVVEVHAVIAMGAKPNHVRLLEYHQITVE